MLEKTFKTLVSTSQLSTLRQMPRHQAILERLGIKVPRNAIVVVGSHGIKILVPAKSGVSEAAQA